jgi:L-rhamnose mutarotase
MKRIGFKMQLKPGCEEAYRHRHAQIWPDLIDLLKTSGISDYVIYLDKSSGTLYASQQVDENFDQEELADHPVMRQWWEHMADLMETNKDLSPVVMPLEEMFYLP